MDKSILVAFEIMCSESYSMKTISDTELCIIGGNSGDIIISNFAYAKLDEMAHLYQDIINDNYDLSDRLTQ